MADVCRNCATRAHRSAVSAVRRHAQRRAFTATAAATKNVSVPAFSETQSPELDHVLLQLRTKHFIPAYLNKRQRHLIFGDKFKTELENSPAYASVGDEEFPLLHIDRTKDIPPRKPLVLKALHLMNENDEWRQLPSLLEGLHKAHPQPDLPLQEKVIRKLQQADQFPIILRCLRRSQFTGLTLKNHAVLDRILWALRLAASADNWDQARLEKALRHAGELAELLESNDHGSGRKVAPNDPRTRPAVIGLFLELHAVYAYKYKGAQDTDAKVKAYAQRLLACFNESTQPAEQDLPQFDLPTEFTTKMSIYHGLNLARSILGNDMPEWSRAGDIVQNYEARLGTLAEALRASGRGYATLALAEWEACIRA